MFDTVIWSLIGVVVGLLAAWLELYLQVGEILSVHPES